MKGVFFDNGPAMAHPRLLGSMEGSMGRWILMQKNVRQKSHWQWCLPRAGCLANALVLAAVACAWVRPPARAGELYTQDFNSYAGTQNANQVTTGLPVAFGGTVTGWNRAGDGTIHAVRLATGNWAPMFYDGNSAGGNNIITTASTIAGPTRRTPPTG